MKKSFLICLLLATITGLLLAWIDTRPHWDDTGISVALVFFAAVFWSYIGRDKPWIWALSVGVWIPAFNIIISQNTGSLLALVPAFIGAYIGFFARRKFLKEEHYR